MNRGSTSNKPALTMAPVMAGMPISVQGGEVSNTISLPPPQKNATRTSQAIGVERKQPPSAQTLPDNNNNNNNDNNDNNNNDNDDDNSSTSTSTTATKEPWVDPTGGYYVDKYHKPTGRTIKEWHAYAQADDDTSDSFSYQQEAQSNGRGIHSVDLTLTFPEEDDEESSTAVDLHEEEDVSSEEKKKEEQLACVKESSKSAAVVSSPPVDNISIDNDSVSVTSDLSTATTRKKKAATHNDKLKVFKTEKQYYEQLEMIMSDEGSLDKKGRRRHPRIPNHGVRVFNGKPYMFAFRSGKEMLDAAPSKRVAICGATYDALVDGVLPSCARDGTIRGDKDCNNGYPIVYKGKDHDFNPVDNGADFAMVMNSFCNFKSKSTWSPKEEEEPSALFTYWNTVGAFGRTTKQVEVKEWKKILSEDELKTATWKVVLSKLHELESVPPVTAVTSSAASIPSAPSNQEFFKVEEALERQNKQWQEAQERQNNQWQDALVQQRVDYLQDNREQRAANERSQALQHEKSRQEMEAQREGSRLQRESNERMQAQQLQTQERMQSDLLSFVKPLLQAQMQQQPPQQQALPPPPQQPTAAVIPEQGRATKARPPPAPTPAKRNVHLILDVNTPIDCTGGKYKGQKGIITKHTPQKYKVELESGDTRYLDPKYVEPQRLFEST